MRSHSTDPSNLDPRTFKQSAHRRRRLAAQWSVALIALVAMSCSSGTEGDKSNTIGGMAGVGGVTGGVGGATGGASGAASGGIGGASGMSGGFAGTVSGAGGASGMSGGASGAAGMAGMTGGMAGMDMSDAGDPDAGGDGDGDVEGCCATCICRGPAPTGLVSEDGDSSYDSYAQGVGCVYYPTTAEPPWAAVALADGFGGSGGCSAFAQTSGWGPFYASHGIVAMIVDTTGGDQPRTRGTKLLGGIEALKAENEDSTSPLFGKLAGRYGTSGFSMGGGGTTFAAAENSELMSSVGLMAWTPTGSGVTVPTLFICGASDGLATCGGHSMPAYGAMPETTDKMLAFVSASHVGQPSAGGGMQGAFALAFQKVYLEGDERWRPILLDIEYESTNIK
jgi:hypothetical protein